MSDHVRFAAKSSPLELAVSTQTGRFHLSWGKNAEIRDIYGEVVYADGRREKTDTRSIHRIDSRPVSDIIGRGIEVTVSHKREDSPDLTHSITLYDAKPEALVQLEVSGGERQYCRSITPIATQSQVHFKHQSSLRSLFVPYDNNNYFRYGSDAWTQSETVEGSYELGALFDDTLRTGLVLGSIDHQRWKSAVKIHRTTGLRATAGITSKFTHDTRPHGTVSGKTIRSPRFLVGVYADWRDGLERYGDLNAIIQPPLPWKGGVPFGWNSWSGHKSSVQGTDATAALNFILTELPLFRSGNTAYINLDSYYDNLSPAERVALVQQAHASGLKAGIYYAPFVNWGEPDWNAIGQYKFRDIQLKTASGDLLPKVSAGWPLDPTHPGTQQRIETKLKEFLDQGFDFIKLDFTTHAALEAQHHDPTVETGTEAYHVGMQHILRTIWRYALDRPVFVSLSIAPLFPHGYGHSRRTSCDVFANIGSSEYLLNSNTYGWWTAGRLYAFNDPDHTCVYQAEGESPSAEAEARTRMTASVVAGGMLLQGDNLTLEPARERVKSLFTNQAVIELAATAPRFRPVNASLGEKAEEVYFHTKNSRTHYLALVNFQPKEARTISIPLRRLGLSGTWRTQELWTGRTGNATEHLDWQLAPMDCALIQLSR
ncbi:MAG: hypothetical protein SFX74_06390 [Fimbriimonadaceae bacterium]|nr:hypothetical protein [Fimbriimonadaceae bacterium]